MAISKMDRMQEPQVLGAILGDIGLDGDDVADVEHGPEHAGPSQASWRASFKRVRRDRAVFVFHIGVHIYERVDALIFRDRGLDRKRFRAVKLRSDRMVCQRRNRQKDQSESHYRQSAERLASHRHLPFYSFFLPPPDSFSFSDLYCSPSCLLVQ